jgi:hypothetical protein
MLQKSTSHIKILGARKVTLSKSHVVDSQILGAILKNIIFYGAWRTGFVHPCARTQ